MLPQALRPATPSGLSGRSEPVDGRLLQERLRLFGGIAFHLHHPGAARERRTANAAVFRATLRNRLRRCTQGLDGHGD